MMLQQVLETHVSICNGQAFLACRMAGEDGALRKLDAFLGGCLTMSRKTPHVIQKYLPDFQNDQTRVLVIYLLRE